MTKEKQRQGEMLPEKYGHVTKNGLGMAYFNCVRSDSTAVMADKDGLYEGHGLLWASQPSLA